VATGEKWPHKQMGAIEHQDGQQCKNIEETYALEVIDRTHVVAHTTDAYRVVMDDVSTD
jgi:hypothetical protein